MGAAVADYDWRSTPLAAMETWAPALRNIVLTVLSTRQPAALFYGPDLTTIFNDGFVPILGRRAETALGQPIHEVWFDVWRDILPLIRRTLSGEAIWLTDLPLLMTRNGFEEQTYWTFSYSPVRDDEGRIVGFLDVVTETTEAVAGRRAIEKANASLAREIERTRDALAAKEVADRERRLLQDELFHRMKNILSVVQAFVSQTIKNSHSLAEAGETVSARLASFARTHDLLTGADWEGAEIHAILRAALEPYQGKDERFSFSGPNMSISAQQSMALALALHELCTNATKYGALSVPEGHVDIRWTIAGGEFVFEWVERGGPPVVPPKQKSFGTQLMERVVANYFSGKARTTFELEGLVYRLEGRLDDLRAARTPEPEREIS
jgi:two-component sensor histidine kinase